MLKSIDTPRLVFVAPTSAKNIIDAFTSWPNWHAEVPPTDSTGCYRADKRLAEIFCTLITLESDQDRLEYLENQVFVTNHFPVPDQEIDRARTVLMEWWLEIYNAKYGFAARHD